MPRVLIRSVCRIAPPPTFSAVFPVGVAVLTVLKDLLLALFLAVRLIGVGCILLVVFEV